jgi:hypothetical protein
MTSNIHCLECGMSFDTRRSLHAHVKSHDMILGDYYVKNFPKFDLFTKEPIPFKNYESYINTDFRNKKNMYKWLGSIEENEKFEYCNNSFTKHMNEDRNFKFAPNYLYFLTHPRLPKIEFFDKEKLNKLFAYFNLKNIFIEDLEECPNFLDIPKDILIFQDTREQKPLKFKNIKSEIVKLDFGDYTAGGDNYSYIYVDRKSENDFQGTMSAGFERFCRELDKAREFNSYIYIVIETNFKQMYLNNNLKFNKKINLSYTWENMRKIIVNYSDICQFVFTGSRENSELIIPFLLKNGNKLKSIDMQLLMEKYKCLG